MRTRKPVVVVCLIVLAALLAGCAPRLLEAPHAAVSEPDAVTFGDGARLSEATSVGFHLELGSSWVPVAGDPALGYAVWEHEGNGCALALTVFGPIADTPHDLPDREGSVRLVDKYALPGGEAGAYRYPIEDGGVLEMAVSRFENESGARITLAREFARLQSALIIDLACGPETNPDDLLRDLGVTATIAADG